MKDGQVSFSFGPPSDDDNEEREAENGINEIEDRGEKGEKGERGGERGGERKRRIVGTDIATSEKKKRKNENVSGMALNATLNGSIDSYTPIDRITSYTTLDHNSNDDRDHGENR